MTIEREKGPHDIGRAIRSLDDLTVESCMLELSSEEQGRAWYASDPMATVDAAMSLASKAMGSAVGNLAMDLVEQDHPIVAAGWHIERCGEIEKGQVHFNMTRPDAPGCWQVCAVFETSLSDEGKARRKVLDDAQAGLSPAQLMSRILKRENNEEDAFRSNPDNYCAPRRGDAVKMISGSALRSSPAVPSGPPERIENFDCTDDQGPFDPDGIWWPGIALTARMPYSWDDDAANASGELGRTDGFLGAELLCVLSSVLRDQGKEVQVKADLEKVESRGFWSACSGRAILLEEIGLCAVRASGGFLDESVMQVIATISNMAAEKSVATVMEDYRTLITRLPELGFDDAEKQYDCNDMDDFMHVTRNGDVATLNLRTQNGEYQLSHDEVAGTLSVKDSVKARNLGTFNVEQVEERTWRAQITAARDVTYCSNNVRSFNDAIHSASSAACCLEEDHPIKEEDPSP